MSGVAFAGPTAGGSSDSDVLSLSGIPAVQPQNTGSVDGAGVPAASKEAVRDSQPLTLDDAGGGGIIVHGFFEYPFKTAYITPRGLVVENKGLVMQPVGGLVFPIDMPAGSAFTDTAFIAGIWNSINTHQDDHFIGAYNEVDFFATLSTKVASNLSLSVTYVPFLSPPHNFSVEHNIEFAVSYDDSKMLGDFALHPYTKVFWAVESQSSTVITGKAGRTFDVEIGMVPGYTYKGITNYPITLQAPIFVTIGPAEYWGFDEKPSNFGTFSAGVTASIPLSFIPKRWGNWHADAGFTYYNLINKNLRLAAFLATNGSTSDENQYVGSVGVGLNF